MTNQTLLEQAAPVSDKRAVVIVGRFQPPTAGHYKLINAAKKFIRENPALLLFTKPIVVIVNGSKSSQNKLENPLSVEDRIYFMKHSGKANGVEFLSANNAFNAFNAVRTAGYEPIVIGAGSDRVDGYIEMLDTKFTDKNGKKQVHYKLEIPERHELPSTRDSLEGLKGRKVGISELSGSLARKAVELGYFDEFVKIVGLENNLPAAKKMYKMIKESMGVN